MWYKNISICSLRTYTNSNKALELVLQTLYPQSISELPVFPTISRRWFLLLHGCKKMVCIDDYSCYTTSPFSTTSFAHAFSLTYLVLLPCLTQIMVCSTDCKDSRYYDTFSPLSFQLSFAARILSSFHQLQIFHPVYVFVLLIAHPQSGASVTTTATFRGTVLYTE